MRKSDFVYLFSEGTASLDGLQRENAKLMLMFWLVINAVVLISRENGDNYGKVPGN